jgi:transcriptional regulator with XRE-family HTH domain
MSQGALGERIGVTFQQVQKYEKGTNRVGASRLVRIAQVLNTTIRELADTIRCHSKSMRKRRKASSNRRRR